MATKPPVCFTDAGTLEPNGMVGKIRRYALVPNAQQTWTNDQLVLALDDQNKNFLIEIVNSLDEEFFVESYVFTVPNAMPWNGTITIPSNSIGLDCRDIWTSNQSSLSQTPFVWNESTRVNPNQVSSFSYGNVSGSFFLAPGCGGLRYYIENNRIQFILPPNTTANNLGVSFVKIRYFQKPSTLVSRTCCAIVTAVNTSTGLITLDNSNSSSVEGVSFNPYYPFSTGSTYDFIQPIQPFVFDAVSVTPSNVTVNANNQTMLVDLPDAALIQIGDICAPTGTAPVLQYVPEEAINVLCQKVVVRLADGQGNDTQLQRANQELQTQTAILQRLLTPKVLDGTKTMTSANDIFSVDSITTYGGMYTGTGT